MTAWYVISIILFIIWVIVFLVGTGIAINVLVQDAEFPREEFQVFAAIMAGALVFVVAHWIVLLLIIPAFFLYGLFAGMKLLVKRPWKETV
jgi:hypothetical protein